MAKYLTFICIVICFSCNSQTTSQKDLEARVSAGAFQSFLSLFYSIELPINYSKETEKLARGSVTLKIIPVEYAKQFLLIPDKRLSAQEHLYDSDTDQVQTNTIKTYPYAQFKYFTDKFVIVCFRHDRGYESDSLFVYLRTFNYSGKPIDSMLVAGQFSKESDWASFVLNASAIEKITYRPNFDNYTIKNNVYQIKDRSKPLTIATIANYKLTPEGTFYPSSSRAEVLLTFELENYKQFGKASDDPIGDK